MNQGDISSQPVLSGKAKVMWKKPIIVIALLMLTAGLLSGCTQDSNTGLEHSEETNYIIGTWGNITTSINSSGVNEYFLRIYNFTDNTFNSTYFSEIGDDIYQSYSDGTYELKDGNLIMVNTTIVPPKKTTFRYSFSYNYTTLTLTDESGQSIVYKQ